MPEAGANRVETSVVVAPFGAQRIWLGIAFLDQSGTWVIWLSVFGRDVEVLTAWQTIKRAEVVLDSYLVAVSAGKDQLMSAVEASRREADHIAPPALTGWQRRQVVRSIAKRAG